VPSDSALLGTTRHHLALLPSHLATIAESLGTSAGSLGTSAGSLGTTQHRKNRIFRDLAASPVPRPPTPDGPPNPNPNKRLGQSLHTLKLSPACDSKSLCFVNLQQLATKPWSRRSSFLQSFSPAHRPPVVLAVPSSC
jgi:hypothetical protein